VLPGVFTCYPTCHLLSHGPIERPWVRKLASPTVPKHRFTNAAPPTSWRSL